jgi:hypothetical protein
LRLSTKPLIIWSMKIPKDVLEARLRMEKADAALHADIESDGMDAEKRIQLIDDLQLAADDYTEKIGRLLVRRPQEFN